MLHELYTIGILHPYYLLWVHLLSIYIIILSLINIHVAMATFQKETKKLSCSILLVLSICLYFYAHQTYAQPTFPRTCTLTNNANSCQGVSNVALWLKVVPGYSGSMTIPSWGLNFGISGGSITEQADGTATMTGTISQGDLSYSLTINLSGRTFSGTPGHSSGCSSYNSGNHADWYYYTGSSGSMNCTTGNASNITLAQKGGAYEVGTGANLWTESAYGGAGWFTINGSDQCDFGPVFNCPDPDPCTATLTASNTGPYCEAAVNTIQLNASVSGATGTITYAWTGPNGFTANIQNPTSTSGAGTYTVTISYKGLNNSSCTEVASTSVIIKKVVATPTFTISDPGCSGTAEGTITVLTPKGTGYVYKLTGGSGFTGPKAGTNTTGIFTRVAGTYTLTVTKSGMCDHTPVTVTVNGANSPTPTPVLAVTQPSCASPQGTVTVTSPLGADIMYNFGNNVYVSNPVLNVTVESTKTITVIAKSTTGCPSTPATATLNPIVGKPNAPAVVATDPICGQTTGSATVTSPLAGGTYNLTSASGPQSSSTGVFTALAPGSYSITVTGSNGCLSSPTSFVVNPPPIGPSAPTVIKTDPSCTEIKGTITVTAPR
jgi:hypothetical protein